VKPTISCVLHLIVTLKSSSTLPYSFCLVKFKEFLILQISSNKYKNFKPEEEHQSTLIFELNFKYAL